MRGFALQVIAINSYDDLCKETCEDKSLGRIIQGN
jgi:hypothetical protein